MHTGSDVNQALMEEKGKGKKKKREWKIKNNIKV